MGTLVMPGPFTLEPGVRPGLPKTSLRLDLGAGLPMMVRAVFFASPTLVVVRAVPIGDAIVFRVEFAGVNARGAAILLPCATPPVVDVVDRAVPTETAVSFAEALVFDVFETVRADETPEAEALLKAAFLVPALEEIEPERMRLLLE